MIKTRHFEDREAYRALDFYKEIVQALKASGTRQILVTLKTDGHLEADIIEADSARNQKALALTRAQKEFI